MTEYGFLIDFDNNGYHAWDARPGDAPNLFGRAAANWDGDDPFYPIFSGSEDGVAGFTVGQVCSTAPANTGNIKDAGLYRLRWTTQTGAFYSSGANKLYLHRYFSKNYDIDLTTEGYTLTLAAGSYRFSVKLKSTAVSITGLALAAVGRTSGTLASTSIGTITSAGYTQVQFTFTVPSEQNVYFQLSKSVTLTFALDLIEPFLISGTGALPPAFNCGTPSLSENLTADVMEARWNVGFKQPWKYVGDENRLTVTLTNADMTYSLENPASPLHRSHRLGPMQIQVVANANAGGWQTLYTGYIESIEPQAMLNGRKTARLVAGTVRRLLDKQELEMTLRENIDSPDLLAALMDFTNLTQVAPYLDRPQLVRMGEAFSTTSTQYKLAGDQWPNGTRVLDAVGDVLMADFGKLWFNRDGDAEYYLRLDYDAILALSMDSLDGTQLSGADYAIEAARANVVHAYSYPRKVTATNETLWTLDDSFTIDAGETIEMSVRFTVTDDEVTVGGKDTFVDTFTAGASVVQSWSADDARGGTITITNNAAVTRTVSAIIIKGKRITWFNAIRQKFRDADAIAKWGKVTEVIENKLIEKRSVAKAHAQWMVAEFAEPRGILKTIRLFAKTEAQRAQYLGYMPGSFLLVSEEQTAHDSRYMVIGEEHELRDGMKAHTIKLYLEQFQRWLVLDDLEAGLLDGGYYLA